MSNHIGDGLFAFDGQQRKTPVVDWSTSQTIFASGAQTATQTSPDLTCRYARELAVVFDLTVNAGAAASLTVSIDGKDPASGKYYNLLTSAAVTAVGTTVYKVGIGLPATANVSANCAVPLTYRVVVTAGNANPATYSVGANLSS
jgi:hypothetical protein